MAFYIMIWSIMILILLLPPGTYILLTSCLEFVVSQSMDTPFETGYAWYQESCYICKLTTNPGKWSFSLITRISCLLIFWTVWIFVMWICWYFLFWIWHSIIATSLIWPSIISRRISWSVIWVCLDIAHVTYLRFIKNSGMIGASMLCVNSL